MRLEAIDYWAHPARLSLDHPVLFPVDPLHALSTAYSMDTEQRQTKTTELQLLAAPAQHSLHRLTHCGLGQSQGIGYAAQCRQGAGSASFAAATCHEVY